MPKYNSVFTLAFSVEHDKIDGSDLVSDDFAYCIHKRVKNLIDNGELYEAVGGPDDTQENPEPDYPLRCPDCKAHDQLTITGEVELTPAQSRGQSEFETIMGLCSADYHDRSRTTCTCGWAGDLEECHT